MSSPSWSLQLRGKVAVSAMCRASEGPSGFAGRLLSLTLALLRLNCFRGRPRADWGLHGGERRAGMSPWRASHPGDTEGVETMRTGHPGRVLGSLCTVLTALALTAAGAQALDTGPATQAGRPNPA